jgi:YD repeat-containing protein
MQDFGYWQGRTNANNTTEFSCTRSSGFRLDGWSFPQGIALTLGYADLAGAIGSDGAGQSSSVNAAIVHPTGAVVTTVGNGLHTLSLAAAGGITTIADETGRSITLDYTGQLTDPLGLVTQTHFGAVQATSPVTRPVPYAQLVQVATPYPSAGPNPGTLDLQYDYDPLGQVSAVHDAVNLQIGYHTVPGGRDPYSFFIADNARGERDDPTGAPYTVVYDTYKHPARYLDEIGRETDATFDSRGRVTSYTYPEHDQEVMGYDDRNNQTSYIRKAKPGSGLSDLTVTAVYDPTWNKPTSITNARGVTTNFTYYASGAGASLMHTAVRPADGNGHGTATYTMTYTPIGKLDTATDPDGVVTDNTYDGTGNLTATALDPAHINSITSYTYDSVGNVVSTTDPRGFTTTSTYDLDRKKT